MKGKWLLLAAAVAVACLYAAAGVQAGECKPPDVVKMQDAVYKTHTKAIVNFTHQKHVTDYKVGCGECHHGKDGKALTALKPGGCVEKCSACHKLPGEASKPEAAKLSGKEKTAFLLQYQADAVHQNCRDCHKDFNKKKNLKAQDKGAAPTGCTQCHAK